MSIVKEIKILVEPEMIFNSVKKQTNKKTSNKILNDIKCCAQLQTKGGQLVEVYLCDVCKLMVCMQLKYCAHY